MKFDFIGGTEGERRRREFERFKTTRSKDLAEKIVEDSKKNETRQREIARSCIERHKIKEVGPWAFVPNLSFFLLVAFQLWEWFIVKNQNLWIFGVLLVFLVPIIMIILIEDSWKTRQAIRADFNEEDHRFSQDYEYGYVYTDNNWEIILYQIAKWSCVALSLLIAGLVIYFIFTSIVSLFFSRISLEQKINMVLLGVVYLLVKDIFYNKNAKG